MALRYFSSSLRLVAEFRFIAGRQVEDHFGGFSSLQRCQTLYQSHELQLSQAIFSGGTATFTPPNIESYDYPKRYHVYTGDWIQALAIYRCRSHMVERTLLTTLLCGLTGSDIPATQPVGYTIARSGHDFKLTHSPWLTFWLHPYLTQPMETNG